MYSLRLQYFKLGVKNLNILYVTFTGWGLFTVLTNPNLESIFADSVETGRRRHVIPSLPQYLAASFGPLLTIVYYVIQGEGLKELEVRPASARSFGWCWNLCFCVSIFVLFDDDKSLGQESDQRKMQKKWIFANLF